jgi:CheY-like chemotaxis protein
MERTTRTEHEHEACSPADVGPRRADQRPVLVVEDEHDLRETVSELLEYDGFRVIQAANGREALALANKTDPCLIVLDLMMPVMTGWQVMETLEQEGRLDSTPVVIVSASHDAPAGARAFLPKPFGLEALLETVEQLAGDQRRH